MPVLIRTINLNFDIIQNVDILTKIEIVSNLQKTSVDVFNTVIQKLEVGLSEADIAELVRIEFEIRGIEEFWYNIPQNVLIGVERFQIGTTSSDYTIKAPSKKVFLNEGSVVFIDISPMDPKTKLWGDWASMAVFHPRKKKDDEQVYFLEEMRAIHRNGITKITSKTTGADVANYYLKIFNQKGITLLDVKNNVGHSLHEGAKNKAQRVWLDQENTNPLGEGVFTVEPGGILQKESRKQILAGRFEECIYIPKEGAAIILGSKELVPLIV